MKLEKFIDKLISVGFTQTDAGENFCEAYENYIDGKGVFVSITAKNAQGSFTIVINIFDDDTQEETEKDYMTTTGAWNSIKKIID